MTKLHGKHLWSALLALLVAVSLTACITTTPPVPPVLPPDPSENDESASQLLAQAAGLEMDAALNEIAQNVSKMINNLDDGPCELENTLFPLIPPEYSACQVVFVKEEKNSSGSNIEAMATDLKSQIQKLSGDGLPKKAGFSYVFAGKRLNYDNTGFGGNPMVESGFNGYLVFVIFAPAG